MIADDTRTLASVETVLDVWPIPEADAIEAVTVRGWTVVVKKGEFAPGDRCLYIEIDAALPMDDERFAFLAPRGTRQYLGCEVHVLKTARLRGVYSQGLVLPLDQFPEAHLDWSIGEPEGEDLDGALGVTKYEPPAPTGMKTLGTFPGILTKTDAERVQNLDAETWAFIQSDPEAWGATEKIDGSSGTAWKTDDGVLHIATRNWEVDPDHGHAHGQAAKYLRLAENLASGDWVQFEVAGDGVQSNGLRLPEVRAFMFGFGTFTHGYCRWPRIDWPRWITDEYATPTYDLRLPPTIEEAVAQVDGLRSLVNPGREAEGVVWTRLDGEGLDALGGRAVFKAINNHWLTKQKD